MLKTIIKSILVIIFSFGVNTKLYALPPDIPRQIPGTVEPGVISKTLNQQQPNQGPTAPAPVASPKELPSSLGPEAERIKFKLTKIVIDGNHIYSEKELSSLYKDKIGKDISVAELMGIVESITNYYRNNGYILSRAILPPQHVANGEVHIRVLEGFVDDIKVIGAPKGAYSVIKAYLGKVSHSRPLQIRVLEYYLRLANELPGVQVKAVLEPSKTTLAAATLNVVSNLKSASGYISYDNYGSLYIGPNEGTMSASLNSIFRSGDTTQITYITTARPKELKYKDLSYTTPIGPSGLKFTYDMNQSNTRPELNLRPLKINGLSNTYSGTFAYPMIRSRATDLTINGAFNYIDSGSEAFGQRLYLDHIRSINVGGVFNHADIYKGVNNITGSMEVGLGLLGATTNPNSFTTSRFGATGRYTKFNLLMSRTQELSPRFSLYLLGKGQYSFNPLLSSVQFPFGGSQVGRGYDAADIIGDMGTGGTIELRMNLMPQLKLLQFMQPYAFYDGGIIWNRRKLPGSNTKQSETSAGAGIRFLFTPNLVGNLLIGQPLTKQDSAEQVVGNGRRPRGFFSITASF
jgi:hemolysin activation/secretion protein